MVESSVLVGAQSPVFGSKVPDADEEDDSGAIEKGATIFSSSWLPGKDPKYNDMAKYAYAAMGRDGAAANIPNQKENVLNLAHVDKPSGLGGIIVGIGEQILAAGYIPHIGKALNFLFLSWMYAYYRFEYKWNLSLKRKPYKELSKKGKFHAKKAKRKRT